MSICKEKVYKDIYYEHSEYLRNFLYYKSGDMQTAEDLAQDAFIKLWENCKKVELAKAKSYLFTIAHNLFLNKVKHNKVVLQFENSSEQKVDNNDPLFILQKNQFKQQLEKAISDLPETQRIVYLMNRIDKKKYREIAEELNISLKAVEKRMHLALKTLRQVHKKV